MSLGSYLNGEWERWKYEEPIYRQRIKEWAEEWGPMPLSRMTHFLDKLPDPQLGRYSFFGMLNDEEIYMSSNRIVGLP